MRESRSTRCEGENPSTRGSISDLRVRFGVSVHDNSCATRRRLRLVTGLGVTARCWSAVFACRSGSCSASTAPCPPLT
eukprot:2000189-Rhodomonas_salina.1